MSQSVGGIQAGRPYFSIGEVLNVLKDAFPDVTVSKIRFLESEGLIQPERTDTGYRKFTEEDIERLRFILRLQREQFLPLKVIRERLEEVDRGGGQSTLAFEEAPSPAPAASRASLQREGTGASFSHSELARASGLSEEQVAELTSYRLLDPTEIREARPDDGNEGAAWLRFDERDLEVAKLSRALLDLGLEPRHLRVFRLAADRWVDLADQMTKPLAKQRNPEAR
ncbi:MAG: transcriptional regulator FtsR, partial [Candidatus Binatia bacterium]